MRNLKGVFSTSLFAFIFWVLFVLQDINILKLDIQELLSGLVISIIIGYFTSILFIKEDGLWIFKKGRIIHLIAYIPFYFIELLKANIEVAKMALSKDLNIRPGIVKIDTELKSEYGLAMLANSITLTPGTITMDIYEEDGGNTMYIHWINVETEDINEAGKIIKGDFEKKVRRIFK